MPKLEMVIWDVQHGSAAYLKTPNGKHFVIDLGTGTHKGSNNTFSPLLYLKQNWGITSIDKVIITHPHTDHIDDIFNLMQLSPVYIQRPFHLSENDIRGNNPSSDKYKIEVVAKFLVINCNE